jgi:hypothetical protein
MNVKHVEWITIFQLKISTNASFYMSMEPKLEA